MRPYIRRPNRRVESASDALRISAEKDSRERRIGLRITPMANGCWLYRFDGDQYHSVRREDGTMTKAHREVYEILVGPVPEGHHLHHECGTPGCVNPAHLTPLTPKEHKAAHRRH